MTKKKTYIEKLSSAIEHEKKKMYESKMKLMELQRLMYIEMIENDKNNTNNKICD